MRQIIAPTAPGVFREIPLAALLESKTNPRTRFDKDYIAELAESIKHVGVVQPITVRHTANARVAQREGGSLWYVETERADGGGWNIYGPPHKTLAEAEAAAEALNNEFEIIAGACRARASKLAKRDTIPAMVRDLTDEQVLRIQLIENLQRQDIHPLDEAEAFRRLKDDLRLTAVEIAEEIGKSEEYVHGRLKLLALSKKSRETILKKEIPTEHAVLIARLNEGDQVRALRYCTSSEQLPTVKDFRRYVDEEIKLANQRETVRATLAGIKADNQLGVMISQRQSWHGVPLVVDGKDVLYSDQYKVAADKPCDTLATGVIVDRLPVDKVGETLMICVGEDCAVHSPRKPQKKQATKAKKAGRKSSKDEPRPELHHLARQLADNRAIGLVRTKTKFGVEDLRFVAYALAYDMTMDAHEDFVIRHGLKASSLRGVDEVIAKAKTTDQLMMLLVELALFGNYYTCQTFLAETRERLAAFEKRYGIDMPKLEAQALEELQAQQAQEQEQTTAEAEQLKPAKKKRLQTSAPKKKKKSTTSAKGKKTKKAKKAKGAK